jgi:hypothetical protein
LHPLKKKSENLSSFDLLNGNKIGHTHREYNLPQIQHNTMYVYTPSLQLTSQSTTMATTMTKNYKDFSMFAM